MPCKIYYFSLTDEQTKTEKLEWFAKTKMQDIDLQLIKPDKNSNWINLADESNGFDEFIPVCSKDAKLGKGGKAIFELYSLGVVTARDEWVYDFSKENLTKKINFLIDKYNQEAERLKGISKNEVRNEIEYSIKWSRAVKNDLSKGKKYTFDEKKIMKSIYRPFVNRYLYFSKELNEMQYQLSKIFGDVGSYDNICIGFIGKDTAKPFSVLAHNSIVGLNFLSPASGCQSFPLYRYVNGEKVENITDWALDLFRNHYSTKNPQGLSDLAGLEKDLGKTDIFHYVYAVLHKPEYRTTYQQNLKREFPRIPLYDDFWKYAAAGKKLMELHLNYETPPLPKEEVVSPPKRGGLGGVELLQRKDLDLEVFKAKMQGKRKKTTEEKTLQGLEDLVRFENKFETAFTVYPILKIKDGNIEIDELTTLCGVPAEALAYKLGNRSAIEWILDQYKPYRSDDKTIQEQFNTYNFADYKEEVIDLLQKVCFVSVETMKIVGEL